MVKNNVILGLGSNIGNRRAKLGEAISILREYIDNIIFSSVYESCALLPEGAPIEWDVPFYNMAIAGSTTLSPDELLAVIKKTEQILGRNKVGHWSPREIDIDILALENLIWDRENLTIPHKELLKRDFVLVPLAEIAPDWIHPIIKKTAKELVKNFPVSSLKLIKKPALVGIINITPDSFSDGGGSFNPYDALENIKKLIDEGADVIDIGAESTRPNAIPLSQAEEWKRLQAVLSNIAGFSIPISLDTRHALSAKKAIELGVNWINDVTGFASVEMVEAVKDSECKLVVMHSLTVPADKNIVLPLDCDPVDIIIKWATKRFAELERAGIGRDRIIFDAGIGFGKNSTQSWEIINNVTRFKVLGVPILIGHSRKSFLGENRSDDATLEISKLMADKEVDYLRVHNILRHRLEIL